MDDIARDDAVLVRACVDHGDDAAFEKLMALHGGVVLGRCLQILHNLADAEDAAQMTWTRAYFNLQHYRAESSLRSWLIVIATRQCFDLRGKRLVPTPAPIDDHDVPEADIAPDVAQRIDMAKAISALDPKDAAVLWLRFYDGHSFAEVSSILGISEAAAKMRATRAKERIRPHVSR